MHKLFLKTSDHQRIAALHYQNEHKKVLILAHGFFNNKDVHLFKEMAKEFSPEYDVVLFDFRGHGKSSGFFCWTSAETADLQAVLEYVKTFKYEAVGVIGFSLGAAISLITAAQNPDIKTVIAVSSPSDFWKIDYHFWEPGMWEDLKLNLGHKGRGKGVRPGNPFSPKTSPINIVDKIAPRPVLFIHGSDDWLIHVHHSRELFEKAKQPKQIEIIEKGGHAEKLFDDQPDVFLKICLDWLKINF
ncbi:MAG: alpha/beta hydrolase [Candidatus Omnitrophica bacterium]|nr:alpha/beta hydrolase [Candidatus Omnitrophota bacterium]